MGNNKKNIGDQKLPNENEENVLAAFSAMDESQMDEGTSTYHKFSQPGEYFDGTFEGIEERSFEENNPDKKTKCAVMKDIDGAKHLFAQTIVVNELEKKWNELKETGFPARIKYVGYAKQGTPEQYQNFRLLFMPVSK